MRKNVPFAWDGTLGDLPTGIDSVGLRSIQSADKPNVLSALAAEVDRPMQRLGLSSLVIATMEHIAAINGLAVLVAPVRPSIKDRYPLIPIDRYAEWRREDGLPFDPWMRVHTRLGAVILRAEPRSKEIVAVVEEWEEWTCMAFPEDGQYVFPGGLAPLAVAGGKGEHFRAQCMDVAQGRWCLSMTCTSVIMTVRRGTSELH